MIKLEIKDQNGILLWSMFYGTTTEANALIAYQQTKPEWDNTWVVTITDLTQ